MGTTQHLTVTAAVISRTAEAEVAAERVRDLLRKAATAEIPWTDPEQGARLLVGPVQSATNGYTIYTLVPSGSKAGWPVAEAVEEAREEFIRSFLPLGYVHGVSTGDAGTWVLDGEHGWKRVDVP